MELQEIAGTLLLSILSIVSVLATFYGKKLVAKFTENMDAQTQAKVQELVSNSIAQACTFAEQWAKKMNKQAVEPSAAISGQEKMNKAVEYAMRELRNNGVGYYSEFDIRDKIESFLGIATINMNAMPEILLDTEETNDEDNDTFLRGN